MKHPKVLLSIVYYIALTLTIIAAMIGYHHYSAGICIEGPVATTVYTVILWYVIITLPLSLKLFSVGVNHLKKLPDDGSREQYYKLYGVLRIVVITIGLIASILCFYLFRNQSLLWLAGISIIGLIFCKPTERRIDYDLTPLTPTETAPISDNDEDEKEKKEKEEQKNAEQI